MKTTNIVSVVYTKYDYAVPDIIASKFIGIVICIIISLFSYVLGYEIYKKDLDNVYYDSFFYKLINRYSINFIIFCSNNSIVYKINIFYM